MRTPTGTHTKQRKQLMGTMVAQAAIRTQGTHQEFGGNAETSPMQRLDRGSYLLALETRAEFTCDTWLTVGSTSMVAVAGTGWICETAAFCPENVAALGSVSVSRC